MQLFADEVHGGHRNLWDQERSTILQSWLLPYFYSYLSPNSVYI